MQRPEKFTRQPPTVPSCHAWESTGLHPQPRQSARKQDMTPSNPVLALNTRVFCSISCTAQGGDDVNVVSPHRKPRAQHAESRATKARQESHLRSKNRAVHLVSHGVVKEVTRAKGAECKTRRTTKTHNRPLDPFPPPPPAPSACFLPTHTFVFLPSEMDVAPDERERSLPSLFFFASPLIQPSSLPRPALLHHKVPPQTAHIHIQAKQAMNGYGYG